MKVQIAILVQPSEVHEDGRGKIENQFIGSFESLLDLLKYAG